MFTDTHVHIDGSLTPGQEEALVCRAREAQVTRLVAVGGSPAMNAAALRLAAAHPECTRAAIGLDRHLGVASGDLAAIGQALAAAPAGRIVALGETGLDYYHAPETRAAQKSLFRQHLDLARELQLPVVVHTREAVEDTLDALTEHARGWTGDPLRRGVIHCFTGDQGFADALLALGFYVSFSGIVTFRNADALRAVAVTVPLDRLLLETDTPYLAPVPHRGKPNEPSFLPCIASRVAELRGLSVAELARVTSQNAARLFGWGIDGCE